MFRKAVLLMLLLIVSVVGINVLLTIMSRQRQAQVVVQPPAPTSPPPTATPPASISVYVTGAVRQPQTTVQIAYRGRVEDAIRAAGGTTDDADMDGVNPAAILSDGDHVHVPQKSRQPAPTPTPPSATAPVNVNTATLEQLQTLPRVGPVIAQRIIDYRTTQGAFTSLQDLGRVSGIGPVMLEGLKDRVIFDMPEP